MINFLEIWFYFSSTPLCWGKTIVGSLLCNCCCVMKVIIHTEPGPQQSHDSGKVGSDSFTALCSVFILSMYSLFFSVWSHGWAWKGQLGEEMKVEARLEEVWVRRREELEIILRGFAVCRDKEMGSYIRWECVWETVLEERFCMLAGRPRRDRRPDAGGGRGKLLSAALQEEIGHRTLGRQRGWRYWWPRTALLE